ncbi:unnamed protein product [Durusdinium trenchii]|uniref:Uncharacterized protein n=2 Tax=Durusdinium trenchii TaxID=1381693 RepID=A0ABP0MNH4_9DINO
MSRDFGLCRVKEFLVGRIRALRPHETSPVTNIAMVLHRSGGPRGLARLQLYNLLRLQGRRTRRCRREESEAELQSQESLLRSCLKRCAIESSSSYEAVLRRLKKAMETNAPRPLNRNEMVIRLEQALRLDMECRQGQVRVRKLRSFEDLGIL